ncbi:DUF4349 domain-containing protein [Thiohalomonas denitrificans]|uniref:DUF4124 domain-containing protein n=1 Tax=Thiohalomonas denitrificans TaxID=415747 RepID=A0A1G5QK80_9GAMM|nr:hypothetical protein [Thiohalomonas denitrificans]SCZ61960.1 hypothetical protein SAMN03097708_02237 [Thiohalomonas denitrificans]
MIPKNLTLLAAGLLLTAVQTAAAIECWTNSDGFRECGNVVPPEYAQDQVNTLNNRGLTVEVKERAKSREELAEERRRNAEAEHRRASEEARRARQENHDRVLLSTFTTEEELIASGNRKTAAIEATIDVTRRSMDNTRKSLQKHEERATRLDQANRPIPESLQQDIISLKRQIADKQAHIDSKEAEKAALQRQNQEDLERFRYLKSRRRR